MATGSAAKEVASGQQCKLKQEDVRLTEDVKEDSS